MTLLNKKSTIFVAEVKWCCFYGVFYICSMLMNSRSTSLFDYVDVEGCKIWGIPIQS